MQPTSQVTQHNSWKENSLDSVNRARGSAFNMPPIWAVKTSENKENCSCQPVLEEQQESIAWWLKG